MGNFGPVLGVFGLLAVIVGLLMFIPLKVLRAKRRVALWLSVGGFVSFVLGLILTPTPAQQGQPEVSATTHPAPSPARSPGSPDIKARVEREATALWASVVRIDEACSSASKRVAKAGASADPYQIYPAAKAAEEACSSASSETNKLLPPASLDGSQKTAFADAIEKCGQAQMVRSTAYSKVAEVVDGNLRPSAVTEAKENLQTAQSASIFCAAGFFDAAAKAGIDTKMFKGE